VNPDAALKALAEPHRRAILELVTRGPRPVGDIAGHLDITPQAVSRHLKVNTGQTTGDDPVSGAGMARQSRACASARRSSPSASSSPVSAAVSRSASRPAWATSAQLMTWSRKGPGPNHRSISCSGDSAVSPGNKASAPALACRNVPFVGNRGGLDRVRAAGFDPVPELGQHPPGVGAHPPAQRRPQRAGGRAQRHRRTDPDRAGPSGPLVY